MTIYMAMMYPICMSHHVMNIADFKNRLGEAIAQIEAGEAIVLSKRNVPFARIVPLAGRPNRSRPGTASETLRIVGDIEAPALPESDYEMLDGGVVP